MSGLLLHKDDVFVHVSHREGYEGPMSVEEEGFLAGSPMVCTSSRISLHCCCAVATIIADHALKGDLQAWPS